MGWESVFTNAQITVDKFHVMAHASTAVNKTRRMVRNILRQLMITRPFEPSAKCTLISP